MSVSLFLLGTVVGSFLNVVGLRWGQKNLFGGRSHCPYCGSTLKWWELIPLVSFLMLRGKCGNCGASISWQYPLIELWTGLIFATVPVMLLPVFCIYIVITIYDFKHKIIPNPLVYTAIIFSLFYFLFFIPYSLINLLAGPILFVFFGLIWFLSRGRAMGFGDAKLGLSIGLLLGAAQGFSAIILAFWLGALVSLTYLVLCKYGLPAQTGFLKNSKELTMKSEVPFAPFIVLGAWLSLIFEINLIYAL